MYKVQMEQECACFKKSEYTKEKSFDNQRDAYNYANTLSEFMNEDFCTTHLFTPQLISDTDFLIRVSANPNAGSSCGTNNSDSSCGTSCGC